MSTKREMKVQRVYKIQCEMYVLTADGGGIEFGKYEGADERIYLTIDEAIAMQAHLGELIELAKKEANHDPA